jgi:hypothetical protein
MIKLNFKRRFLMANWYDMMAQWCDVVAQWFLFGGSMVEICWLIV